MLRAEVFGFEEFIVVAEGYAAVAAGCFDSEIVGLIGHSHIIIAGMARSGIGRCSMMSWDNLDSNVGIAIIVGLRAVEW